MPIYLDAGVMQVQAYLGRTPKLLPLRGASAMISRATAPDGLPALLGDLAHAAIVNPEAGDVDGVMSVQVDDAHDPQEVAERLLAGLRRNLPSATLGAAWGNGDTYLEAYPEIATMRRDGTSPTSLPPLADVPLARRCQWCRLDPVAATITEHGEARAVCADCRLRAEAGGHRTRPEGIGRDIGLGAEHRLLRRLTDRGHGDLVPVDDFSDLAALGPGTKRNHVATVYVDGNSVGRFFAQLLAVPGVEDSAKGRLSKLLSEATWSALEAATAEVLLADETRLPAIAHIVGGDDVLVTLPTRRALPFVRTLVATFGQRMAGAVADLPGAAEVQPPTCSAGVVFAHQSFPFARQQRAASEALRDAKCVASGDAASLAWLDITRHGDAQPVHGAWTLADLDDRWSLVAELAALPAHLTSRLADLLATADERTQRALLRSEPRRLGLPTPLADQLTDPDLPVAACLDLARWWPESEEP